MPLSPFVKQKLSVLRYSKSITSDATRFILAGLGNTALTLIIYQIALSFFQYRTAYAISWIIGVGVIVILYPSKVFVGASRSWRSKIAIVFIYLMVFFSGLIFIDQLAAWGCSARLSIFIVIVFTTALNFLLMRLVLRKLLNLPQ